MSLRFLRYVRPPVAAALTRQAGDPQARVRAGIDPSLTLRTEYANGQIAAWTAAGATLSVLGPADAVALAAGQVLARTPAVDAAGVPPTQFASIEFVRPDLPWLFTPLAPDANDRLPPWLCLVAVPAPLAELAPGPHGALLRLGAAGSACLPNLAHAAEWAHVQEGDARAGDDRDAVAAGAVAAPRRFRSRLLCPTALQPDTDYLACVVPTFLGGRQAGLGEAVALDDAALLGPAWTVGQPVELPVYDHWRFSTGAAESFAALALRLQPYDPGAAEGRTLDAGAPDGTAGPHFADTALALDAVMTPRSAAPPAPPSTALARHLGTRLADASPLAPPVVGGRHARALPPTPRSPAWVRTLNLDPVRRVAAGLGAEVVRRHQEEMMAAIWEQAGEIERANQLLRLGQTARAAAMALFLRRLAPDLDRARDGGDLTALLWLAPMLGHLPLAGGLTARAEVSRSCLPTLATSGAFRKWARPNAGPMRRLRRLRDGRDGSVELLLRLADGGGRRPSTPTPDAAVLTAAELAGLGAVRPSPFGTRLPTPLPRPPLGGIVLDPNIVLPGRRPVAPATLPGARVLATRLAQPRSHDCRPLGAAGGSVREALFEDLRAAADPATTLPRRTRARIALDPASPAAVTPVAAAPGDDALDPILVAPKLPWPMLRPLLALSLDWMAPSLAARGAPEDYIALLTANPAFIESYLAGLNEEIGREMLWRGFPTDQRGTVFDRFWSGDRAEWPPLHRWTGTLGSHGLPGTVPTLVIAIRGALLRRFDRAKVFLQKANAAHPPAPLPTLGDPAATQYPLVETRLPGDIACFGFDLTEDEAIGGPGRGNGWFLVFQEPPTDLRFGPPAGTTAGHHVAGSGDADLFAETALRPPQRVYLHAATLLGRV